MKDVVLLIYQCKLINEPLNTNLKVDLDLESYCISMNRPTFVLVLNQFAFPRKGPHLVHHPYSGFPWFSSSTLGLIVK